MIRAKAVRHPSGGGRQRNFTVISGAGKADRQRRWQRDFHRGAGLSPSVDIWDNLPPRTTTRALIMQIATNSVVSFHYTLRDETGEQLESSQGGHPMTYLHGQDALLKGLEDALAGKKQGDSFTVTLAPELAFGELRADSELRVPLSQLRGAKKWEPGMQAVIQTQHGHQQVTVLKVGHTMATVDTNHPMAGKTLVFNVEVVEVRAASPEELSHGHVHGPGGHHH
jgi:FKBP-type peptidyl-prolyl cis-trans isomerase SlyD